MSVAFQPTLTRDTSRDELKLLGEAAAQIRVLSGWLTSITGRRVTFSQTIAILCLRQTPESLTELARDFLASSAEPTPDAEPTPGTVDA